MRTHRALQLSWLLLALLLSGLATAGTRPITDFTSRQGAYCLISADCTLGGYGKTGCDLFVPPQPNVGGWSDPKTSFFVLADYAGLADPLLGYRLGTRVDGSVTEVPLADGRAQVQVVLRTTNALTWASDVSSTFPGPTLFGHTLAEVLGGGDAAVGTSVLQLQFKNTAPGAALPDLIQLIFCPEPGQVLEMMSCRVQASGTLRAAFGVPDGTPGRLEMVQSGLVWTAGMANPRSRVALDAFPAEKVIIKATGR